VKATLVVKSGRGAQVTTATTEAVIEQQRMTMKQYFDHQCKKKKTNIRKMKNIYTSICEHAKEERELKKLIMTQNE